MQILGILFLAMLAWAAGMAVNAHRLRKRYRKKLTEKLDDEYKNTL